MPEAIMKLVNGVVGQAGAEALLGQLLISACTRMSVTQLRLFLASPAVLNAASIANLDTAQLLTEFNDMLAHVEQLLKHQGYSFQTSPLGSFWVHFGPGEVTSSETVATREDAVLLALKHFEAGALTMSMKH